MQHVANILAFLFIASIYIVALVGIAALVWHLAVYLAALTLGQVAIVIVSFVLGRWSSPK